MKIDRGTKDCALNRDVDRISGSLSSFNMVGFVAVVEGVVSDVVVLRAAEAMAEREAAMLIAS